MVIPLVKEAVIAARMWFVERIARLHMDGIHVHNIDSILNRGGNAVNGKLAEKVLKIVGRAVVLVSRNGAVLVDQKPTEEFLAYFEEVYGFRPMVFSLEEPLRDGAVGLTSYAPEDEKLLDRMRGWLCEGKQLVSYISDPSIHVLAEKLGVGVLGVPLEALREQALSQVSNKSVMREHFRELGLKTPDGVLVRSADALYNEAQRVFDQYQRVFMRQVNGDGGLGNVAITQEELDKKGCTTVQDYLEHVLLSREDVGSIEEWTSSGVLVERFHKFKKEPGILIYISPQGNVFIVQVHQQLIKGGSYCVGIVSHPDEQKLFGSTTLPWRLRRIGMRVGKFLASQGLTGTFASIDVGVEEDGTIRCLEVNPRMTAAMVGLFQRVHFGILRRRQFTYTNDQFEIPEHITLADIKRFLCKYMAHWDEEKKRGIIVTREPAHGSMGFAIHAQNQEELDRCLGLMAELLRLEHRKVA